MGTRKIGRVLEVLRARARTIGIGRTICPVLKTYMEHRILLLDSLWRSHSWSSLLMNIFDKILNDNHTDNLCLLSSLQEVIEIEVASDLLHTFIQSVKFYTFHCHLLKSTYVWKRKLIKFQINRKWMVAPFSKFYIKISVSFYLNVGKYTFGGSILKPTAIA